ncbi:glycosyltransferase family 2 protein [Cryobacterium sp. SO2]|uniref:glycosyltransferase family 2 protein n=1 Tax=Cryobacterium sp. SO2 TaxID=1897060 RepID=UPI00223D6942|nr:glycosyltransferase family 2 protein [Cryobacterium sp. SO2]WEO78563.1 glycosyltransferase family 2 protein [Cryobacterium sp. SO2]
MRSDLGGPRTPITISVVIPVYNDAVFLRTCLRALSQQRRPADEIVVVDNASTDASATVARAAGARLVTEPLRGIWPAAAAGYDAATGDVIARLDADSVPPVDWLERIEARFTADPDTAVYTGPGDFYDCGPVTAWLGARLYIGGYFRWMGVWLGHPVLFGSNFAMRRQVWAANRGRVRRRRRDVHDDLDFSMHLGPEEPVTVDRTLRVGISARPFETPHGLGRRVAWAGRTLFSAWPAYSPWHIRRRNQRPRA